MSNFAKRSDQLLIEDLVLAGFCGNDNGVYGVALEAASRSKEYVVGRLIREICKPTRSSRERLRMMSAIETLGGTMAPDQLAVLARIRWDDGENRDLRIRANAVLEMAARHGVDVPNALEAANAAVPQTNEHDAGCDVRNDLDDLTTLRLIATALARYQRGEVAELAVEVARRSRRAVNYFHWELVRGRHSAAQRARLLDAITKLGGISSESHYVDLQMVRLREKGPTAPRVMAEKLLNDGARFAPADQAALLKAMHRRGEQFAQRRRRARRS